MTVSRVAHTDGLLPRQSYHTNIHTLDHETEAWLLNLETIWSFQKGLHSGTEVKDFYTKAQGFLKRNSTKYTRKFYKKTPFKKHP